MTSGNGARVGWGKAGTGFPLASYYKFLEAITFMILYWSNPKSS
jgi:hypothetical protein